MLVSTASQVLIPIGSGSEEMEAVILVDVLRRAGADVIVASVEKDLQIEASRKVKLVADKVIEKCADQVFDLIVLPGGMPGAERLRDCEVLQQITTHHAREGRPYAAICAAPAVALLPWGLLGGLLATAHPAFVNKLPEKSAAEERVVTDGMLTTSRGPGTAFELALALVERLYGVHRAHEVAAPMDARGMWSSHIGEGNVSSSRDHPPQVYSLSLAFFSLYFVRSGAHLVKSPHDACGAVCLYADKPVIVVMCPQQVLLPIANGSEEMEAVIITDVLRRAGALVVIASVEEETGLEITASRGVHIVADAMISDVKDTAFDLVVLPVSVGVPATLTQGGMPGAQRLASCDTLDALLKDHVTSNRLCAAICAAPSVVLHAKGLLWNKKATAHPAFSDTLMDQTAVAARVVHDGGMVTSRGPGTAMEFALYLVECLFGPEKAAQVAEPMVLKPALTRFPGA
eukprot:jgi/Mesen1/8636/ME000050S08048